MECEWLLNFILLFRLICDKRNYTPIFLRRIKVYFNKQVKRLTPVMYKPSKKQKQNNNKKQ